MAFMSTPRRRETKSSSSAGQNFTSALTPRALTGEQRIVCVF
jgi:hypothetical protein